MQGLVASRTSQSNGNTFNSLLAPFGESRVQQPHPDYLGRIGDTSSSNPPSDQTSGSQMGVIERNGLAGFLATISSEDPIVRGLAKGIDLNTLGMNLNSVEFVPTSSLALRQWLTWNSGHCTILGVVHSQSLDRDLSSLTSSSLNAILSKMCTGSVKKSPDLQTKRYSTSSTLSRGISCKNLLLLSCKFSVALKPQNVYLQLHQNRVISC